MLKKLFTGRNVGNLVGVLLVVYAIWGYLSDEIRVLAGRGKNVRVPVAYVHDSEQVMLAGLGYVAFAVAAFLFAAASVEKPAVPPGDTPKNKYLVEVPGKWFLATAFIAIGIVLLGFRNPN